MFGQKHMKMPGSKLLQLQTRLQGGHTLPIRCLHPICPYFFHHCPGSSNFGRAECQVPSLTCLHTVPLQGGTAVLQQQFEPGCLCQQHGQAAWVHSINPELAFVMLQQRVPLQGTTAALTLSSCSLYQ